MRSRHPVRIIFLNRFFYPDHSATSELLSDLAFSLSQRGFAITVIASQLRYEATNDVLPAHEIIRGVEVFRVQTSRWGRHRLWGRLLDYASFYISAGWRLWRLAHRDDVIVAKTDPPLLSVLAASIAWLSGAKLINWQQDIFPEVAEGLELGGKIGRVGFALLRAPRNWSLRRGSVNVVLGSRMAEKLEQFGITPDAIRTIPNWADGKLIIPIEASQNVLRDKWKLQNDFVVGYAGNLGRAHEMETVLGAMKALSQDAPDAANNSTPRPIKFVFTGGGVLRQRLEEEARKCKLTNVEFHGYQPRDQLALALGVADVHLVILNPRLEGLIVPSKIYAIAAAGRPAIFIGSQNGEVGQLLKVGGWGFTVAPTDVTELKCRILELARSPELCRLMGGRARAAFEQDWDGPIALRQWEELLANFTNRDNH